MHLRLIYFNFPFWRAEVSRLALHLAGIPFEDVRPSRDEFMTLKGSGKLPYGQLPVLEVDGQVLAQSGAIARFCGKLAGLYPNEDAMAAARVDELLETATDITAQFGPSMRVKDPDEKAAMRHKLGTEILPKWLGFLESRLQENDEKAFFVGPQMTIADLVIWRLNGWLTSGVLDGIPRDLLKDFPGLLAHFRRIDEQPAIADWMAQYNNG